MLAAVAVGVIINFQNRKVLQGISRFALSNGWKLVLESTHDLERDDIGHEWDNADINGILVDVVGRKSRSVAQLKRPVVNVSDVVSPPADVPTVGVDNAAVGRLVAEHLLLQPVSHFAFIGQPNRYYSEMRCRGFVDALELAGHRCATLMSENRKEIAEWVAKLNKPVGVMVGNDLHAARVLNSCMAAGVEVRGRVALVSVDNDSALCHATFPSLTSVANQSERVGWEAARMLDGMMAAVARGAPLPRPANILLPPLGIEIRESSILHPVDAELVEALRLIREELAKIHSVDDLANQLGVHRRTLERRFEAVLGRSPLDEMRRARVILARQMLAGSNLSIAQIARQCGYGSIKGMGQAFRQIVGCTPIAYRIAMRRNPRN